MDTTSPNSSNGIVIVSVPCSSNLDLRRSLSTPVCSEFMNNLINWLFKGDVGIVKGESGGDCETRKAGEEVKRGGGSVFNNRRESTIIHRIISHIVYRISLPSLFPFPFPF